MRKIFYSTNDNDSVDCISSDSETAEEKFLSGIVEDDTVMYLLCCLADDD